MPDKAWKAFERRIARYLGGKRRGAYVRDSTGGKTDVVLPGWAVECKLLSRPNHGQMLLAALQAENNKEKPEDFAVAFVKKKGQKDVNTLVVMRLHEFLRLYKAMLEE